jgi:flagellar biosynthesis protein FlhG
MTNIHHRTKMSFLKQLPKTPVDYVIVDTGAGSSDQVVDAFLNGDIKLTISTPTRPALENMFHFIKATAYRKIKDTLKKQNSRALLTAEAEENLITGKKTIKDIVEGIFDTDHEIGKALALSLAQMNLGFIVNKVQESYDALVGAEMEKLLGTNFGWKIQHVANLSFDAEVETLERSCIIPTAVEDSVYSGEVWNLVKVLDALRPTAL